MFRVRLFSYGNPFFCKNTLSNKIFYKNNKSHLTENNIQLSFVFKEKSKQFLTEYRMWNVEKFYVKCVENFKILNDIRGYVLCGYVCKIVMQNFTEMEQAVKIPNSLHSSYRHRHYDPTIYPAH